MKIIPKVKWHYPLNVERSYLIFIRRLFRKLAADVKAKLTPYMAMALANNRYNHDSEADDIDNIIGDVAIINKADLAAGLKKLAQNCSTYNKAQFMKVMKNAIGIDVFQTEPKLADMLDIWVSDNIALIKKLEGAAVTTAGSLAKQSVMNGWSMKQFEDELKKRIDITDRHAKLIACDQTGKLNSSLSKYRQTECGIEQYIWKTAHDSRVRDAHRNRNDHVFSWDKPPDDGHPGFPVRCRCIALPIVDTNDFMYKGVIPQSELAGKNARRSVEVLEGEKISEKALAGGGKSDIIKSMKNELITKNNAVIQTVKIRDYVLNKEHPIGKDKAVAFEEVLGYNQDNYILLKKKILSTIDEYTPSFQREDEYGKRYNIIIPIEGLKGRVAKVLTAWIIKKEENPRLTSAYITNKKLSERIGNNEEN